MLAAFRCEAWSAHFPDARGIRAVLGIRRSAPKVVRVSAQAGSALHVFSTLPSPAAASMTKKRR
jgi:hypothetical protein